MTGVAVGSYYFGDQRYEQVPRIHRWLRGDESQPFVLGGEGRDYWFAAYYLCRAILGWADCGRGIKLLEHPHTPDGAARVLHVAWHARVSRRHSRAGLGGGSSP